MTSFGQNIRRKFESMKRDYEFLTCTCIMDAWERRIVNLTLVSVLGFDNVHPCSYIHIGKN